MAAPRSICLAGVGARTAVGLTAVTSAAAIRARVSRIREHSCLIDRQYRPFTTAEASWLGDVDGSAARMVALGRPALAEALAPALARGSLTGLRVGLFLGLPSLRPGLDEPALASVTRQLGSAALPGGRLQVLERFLDDQAGCATALVAANARLQADELDACLVGGVDSLLCPETLDALESSRRLFGEDNPWGLVPGEAAAFCLVLTVRGCARLGLRPLAEVESMAVTREPACLGSDAVCIGLGLRRAFETALAGLGDASLMVDHILCDLNGEPYRADELAFALVRTSPRFVRPGAFRAPADGWGDVGAAAGALHMILAACAWQRSYAEGPRVLVSSSAGRGPHRSAVILREMVPPTHAPGDTRWPSRSTSMG